MDAETCMRLINVGSGRCDNNLTQSKRHSSPPTTVCPLGSAIGADAGRAWTALDIALHKPRVEDKTAIWTSLSLYVRVRVQHASLRSGKRWQVSLVIAPKIKTSAGL